MRWERKRDKEREKSKMQIMYCPQGAKGAHVVEPYHAMTKLFLLHTHTHTQTHALWNTEKCRICKFKRKHFYEYFDWFVCDVKLLGWK